MHREQNQPLFVQLHFQGKLKYREQITTGFHQMPQAFMGLFKGENIGKAVVKIEDDSNFDVKM